MDRDMEILFIAKLFMKISLAWLGVVALAQNFDQEIYKLIVSGTPSKIAQWLGFFYLAFIVIKKGIETWEFWKRARYHVKKESEQYKQEKIKTNKDQKDYESGSKGN